MPRLLKFLILLLIPTGITAGLGAHQYLKASDRKARNEAIKKDSMECKDQLCCKEECKKEKQNEQCKCPEGEKKR